MRSSGSVPEARTSTQASAPSPFLGASKRFHAVERSPEYLEDPYEQASRPLDARVLVGQVRSVQPVMASVPGADLRPMACFHGHDVGPAGD